MPTVSELTERVVSLEAQVEQIFEVKKEFNKFKNWLIWIAGIDIVSHVATGSGTVSVKTLMDSLTK